MRSENAEQLSVQGILKGTDLEHQFSRGKIFARAKVETTVKPTRLSDLLRADSNEISPTLRRRESSPFIGYRCEFYATLKDRLKKSALFLSPESAPLFVERVLYALKNEKSAKVRDEAIMPLLRYVTGTEPTRTARFEDYETEIPLLKHILSLPGDDLNFQATPTSYALLHAMIEKADPRGPEGATLRAIATKLIITDTDFKHEEMHGLATFDLIKYVSSFSALAAADIDLVTVEKLNTRLANSVRQHPSLLSREFISLQTALLDQKDKWIPASILQGINSNKPVSETSLKRYRAIKSFNDTVKWLREEAAWNLCECAEQTLHNTLSHTHRSEQPVATVDVLFPESIIVKLERLDSDALPRNPRDKIHSTIQLITDLKVSEQLTPK
jgi:hypothetical protein